MKMLQKEDLDFMKVSELVGEIGAPEMSILGMVEGESTSKNIAFKARHKETTSSSMRRRMMKKKMKKAPHVKMMKNLLV